MEYSVIREESWDDFVKDTILPLCKKDNGPIVFALVGELGSGKTTFSKNFLHALGIKQHIQSPTFSIMNSYDVDFENYKKVIHMDVYRIDDINELKVLHIDEIFSNNKNIIVIEWADKIKKIIPQNAIWIYFEHDTFNTRKIRIDKND